jgi:acylphosphatase
MDKKFGKVQIFVSGRVQGVFFRDTARRKAKKLKLNGWVRNLSNGSVEILAEGEKEKLEELIRWAKKGPILARVDKIKTNWSDFSGRFKKFEIKFD